MKLADSSAEGEKQRQFDRELRNMISALTRTVADRSSSGSNRHEEEDENGVRIITLSGTNTGASMRSELDEKSGGEVDDYVGEDEAADVLSTFVNSNFQAVNNSIMMGGSYSTNDPGVHLDVSNVFDRSADTNKPSLKKHKKGKARKDKSALKNDQNQSADSD